MMNRTRGFARLAASYSAYAAGLLVLVVLLSSCMAAPLTSGQAAQTIRARAATSTPTQARPTAWPTLPVLGSWDLGNLSIGIAFKFPVDRDGVQHGQAPLEVTVYANSWAYQHEAPMGCVEVAWYWGDGEVDRRVCSGEDEEATLARHTYKIPGIYYPRVWLRLPGGGEATSYSRTVAVERAWGGRAVTRNAVVYWGLWSLTVLAFAGGWALLGKQRAKRLARRWRWSGRTLLVLLLTAFVPPFSYLPNPLGLALAVGGHYSYDPRLPFEAKFLIAGDPTARLTPKLNGLLGQTGLDPLDPVHPLADFEFTRVAFPDGNMEHWYDAVMVRAQMTYADGTKRSYDIPVQPDYSPGGLYRTFLERTWRWNDINRVYAEHAELPNTPFAEKGAPLQLSAPERLALHPRAERLEAAYAGNWNYLGASLDELEQALRLSPDGEGLLMNRYGGWTPDGSKYELWLAPLDGSEPLMLTDNVLHYDWSSDGEYVIYNEPRYGHAVHVVRPDGSGRRRLNLSGRAVARLPGLTKEGAWYVKDMEVWIAPLDGGPARQVEGFGEVRSYVAYPSPDGIRIAYPVGNVWHIQERGRGEGRALSPEESEWNVVAAGDYDPTDIAWSNDGSKLALVTWKGGEWYNKGDARLTVVAADGRALHSAPLAEYGKAGTPQWLPDGDHVLVQSTAHGGRRISLMEVASGRAWDLSRSRWDAWFALDRGGKYLVLSNGRGGFWRTELVPSVRGPSIRR